MRKSCLLLDIRAGRVITDYLQPLVLRFAFVFCETSSLLAFLKLSVQRCFADVEDGCCYGYVAIGLSNCFADSNSFEFFEGKCG